MIQLLLTLKSVYRLALQGFATSLQRLGVAQLMVPNYTTLDRRVKTLTGDKLRVRKMPKWL